MEEVLSGLHEVGVSLWGLVSGLAVGVWDLVSAVVVWSGDLLLVLHNDAPRLEGLLLGGLLAWLMLRRDKHPLLRVLSAPLKLVVDILDLAWDQVVEVFSDVWGTARNWVTGTWKWCWGNVTGLYSWVMNGLKAVKNKLSKKD